MTSTTAELVITFCSAIQKIYNWAEEVEGGEGGQQHQWNTTLFTETV